MNNSTVSFTSEPSSNSSYSFIEITTLLDLCMYFINLLFGFPTHFYVLWLIVRGSSGVSSEFFNLNLCVCEIGICMNNFFNAISYVIDFLHLNRGAWFLLGLIVTGRPLLQCLICVERYQAVVHPVTFLKYKPLRYRVICCVIVWIINLGSCLCCMYTTEQFKLKIYIYFYTIQFFIFLSVQLFCLVAVLRALKQSGPGDRKREKEENHMKRRAFHLILISTLTMFIIYLPLIISGFFYILTGVFIRSIFSYAFSFFILAGFVQPLLYLHRSGKLSCLRSLRNIRAN